MEKRENISKLCEEYIHQVWCMEELKDGGAFALYGLEQHLNKLHDELCDMLEIDHEKSKDILFYLDEKIGLDFSKMPSESDLRNYAEKLLDLLLKDEELENCAGVGKCDKYCNSKAESTCRGLLQKAYERIKEYEELEEQRRLLKLPCTVGDTVYHFCKESGQILEYEVDCINIILDGVIIISCIPYSQLSLKNEIDDAVVDEFLANITDFDFNTSTPERFVSLKRTEVEQKIKEMEDKKNG